MKVRIKGETYEWKGEDTLTLTEGIALEKATGLSLETFEKGLADHGLAAIQALIWIAMRRSGKTITLDEVGDFGITELEFVDDDGKVRDGAGKAQNRAARRSKGKPKRKR